MRLVGFDSSLRDQLDNFHDKQESVELLDCEVKRDSKSNEMEIFLTPTKVNTSPKKFDMKRIREMANPNMKLKDIDTRNTFDKVCVDAKVSNPAKVSGNYTKQDITLADSDGVAKIVLWQNDVGKLTEGKSYSFTNVVVRSYQGTKYLSMPKGRRCLYRFRKSG